MIVHPPGIALGTLALTSQQAISIIIVLQGYMYYPPNSINPALKLGFSLELSQSNFDTRCISSDDFFSCLPGGFMDTHPWNGYLDSFTAIIASKENTIFSLNF